MIRSLLLSCLILYAGNTLSINLWKPLYVVLAAAAAANGGSLNRETLSGSDVIKGSRSLPQSGSFMITTSKFDPTDNPRVDKSTPIKVTKKPKKHHHEEPFENVSVSTEVTVTANFTTIEPECEPYSKYEGGFCKIEETTVTKRVFPCDDYCERNECAAVYCDGKPCSPAK